MLLRLQIISDPVNWLEIQLGHGRRYRCGCVEDNFLGGYPAAGRAAGHPQDLYEAHPIDGASPWQSFRQITLP